MIRHLAIEPQPAEPAVGEVQMHLLAQAALGPDAHAIAHDQHPHHQLGIDRGPADAAVKRLQFQADAVKIEEDIDPPLQVIEGNMIIEAEIVEQLRRCNLNTHHRPALQKAAGRWNHGAPN
jgi:hypothetical protein